MHEVPVLETPDQEVACADCKESRKHPKRTCCRTASTRTGIRTERCTIFCGRWCSCTLDMVKLIKEVIKIRIYIYIKRFLTSVPLNRNLRLQKNTSLISFLPSSLQLWLHLLALVWMMAHLDVEVGNHMGHNHQSCTDYMGCVHLVV